MDRVVIVLVAILAVLFQQHRLDSLRGEYDQYRANLVARAGAAEHEARQTEQRRQITTQGINDALSKEVRNLDSALAAERTDAVVLRSLVSDYAAGPATSTPDTPELADAKHRATTLGHLLEQADSLAEELAGAAERHASEARALKAQVVDDRR